MMAPCGIEIKVGQVWQLGDSGEYTVIDFGGFGKKGKDRYARLVCDECMDHPIHVMDFDFRNYKLVKESGN